MSTVVDLDSMRPHAAVQAQCPHCGAGEGTWFAVVIPPERMCEIHCPMCREPLGHNFDEGADVCTCGAAYEAGK